MKDPLLTSLSRPSSIAFFGVASAIVEQFIRRIGKKFQPELNALQLDLDLPRGELLSLWRSELGGIIQGFNAGPNSVDRGTLFSQFLLLLTSTRTLDGRSFDFTTLHPVLLGHTIVEAGSYRMAVQAECVELHPTAAIPLLPRRRFLKKPGHLTLPADEADATVIEVGGMTLGIVTTDYWASFNSYQPLAGSDMKKTQGFSGAARRALETLLTVDSLYGLWVAAVLRYVILMRRTNETRINKSRSILFRFGGIEINPNVDDAEIMELLVHECSHQYYHMLSLVRPLHQDSSTLCHSAATDSLRPVERLLIAYHAQVNISIFLAKAIDSVTPAQRDSIHRLESSGIRKLNSLDSQLARHAEAGLSPHGLVLYETLANAAQEHNLLAKGAIC